MDIKTRASAISDILCLPILRIPEILAQSMLPGASRGQRQLKVADHVPAP